MLSARTQRGGRFMKAARQGNLQCRAGRQQTRCAELGFLSGEARQRKSSAWTRRACLDHPTYHACDSAEILSTAQQGMRRKPNVIHHMTHKRRKLSGRVTHRLAARRRGCQ